MYYTTTTTPTTTTSPAVRQNSVPESVFPISKIQFQLIKCLHHLRLLKNNTPKTWTNAVNNWANNVNFAFSNELTSAKISSTCSFFMEQLKCVGVEHYERCLTESFDFLSAQFFSINKDMFNQSTQTVFRWYQKQFSKRFSNQIINDADDIFHWLYNQSCQNHQKDQQLKYQISLHNGTRSVNQNTVNSTAKPAPQLSSKGVQTSPEQTSPRHKRKSAPPVLVKKINRFTAHSETWPNDHLFTDLITNESSTGQQIDQEPAVHPQSPPDNQQIVIEPTVPEPSQYTLTQLWGSNNNSVVGSIDKLSGEINNGSHDNLLLGDASWNRICLSKPFKHLQYSGKVTTLRSIMDKVNGECMCKNLLINFSANNCNADLNKTITSTLYNINKSLKLKFPQAKIFIILIGINNDHQINIQQKIESINAALREKFSDFVIINPPDNFKCVNNIFTDDTASSFTNLINTFLV